MTAFVCIFKCTLYCVVVTILDYYKLSKVYNEISSACVLDLLVLKIIIGYS